MGHAPPVPRHQGGSVSAAPSVEDTRDQVVDALLDLAALSADEIADILSEAGYAGPCGNTVRCPVAQYLADVVGPTVDLTVAVGPTEAHLFRDGIDADNSAATLADVWLPDSVAAFIERFDSGAYPDLHEGDSVAINLTDVEKDQLRLEFFPWENP